MKRAKKRTKLTLNRNTVRILDELGLSKVGAGGILNNTDMPECSSSFTLVAACH